MTDPQPPDSKIVLDHDGDAVTLLIPPPGILKGGKGLMRFSLMLIIIPAAAALAMIGGWGFKPFLTLWCLALAIIGCIGIYLVLVRGTSRGIIDVAEGHLLITTAHLFARQQYQWPLDELLHVSVGLAGQRMDKGLPFEMHVQPVHGRRLGFFPGRNRPELDWVVATVRQAMQMPAQPDPEKLEARKQAHLQYVRQLRQAVDHVLSRRDLWDRY